MINAFVEAFLDPERRSKRNRADVGPDLKKALEWRNRLKDLNADLKPDSTTFAILVRYAISVNDLALATKFLWEMEHEGIPAETLLTNSRFADQEERVPLEALLRSIGKDTLAVADEPQSIAERVLAQASSAKTNDPKTSASASDGLMLSAMQEFNSHATSPVSPAPATPISSLASAELRGTDSIGVRILRRTLDSLDRNPTISKLERQQILEEKALLAAVEEREATREKLPANMKNMTQMPTQLMASWHKLLVPLIKREIQALEEATSDADEHSYLPFLKLLTPEQLSRICITEFMRLPGRQESGRIATSGAKTTVSLLSGIGRNIEMEYNLQQMKKKKNKKFLETQMGIHNLHMNGRLFNITMRKIMSQLAQKEWMINEKDSWRPSWPETVHVKAGAVLSVLLMKVAKVLVPVADPSDPTKDILRECFAFEHSFEIQPTKRIGIIKYHPDLLERLSTDPVFIHPRLMPMLVKPRPWVTRNTGGYLNYHSDVVRYNHNAEHVAYVKAADERGHLSLVYESLDVLGSTAWTINEKIFDVARQLWNTGEAIADLPPAELPAPPKKPDNWESLPVAERKAFMYKKRKMESDRRNAFSQRCDTNYKLEIARAFIGETFYFPHNLDFRGRAYPMAAHLTHMGNDLCRGLLKFATKKPLGANGLRWLKIQVASLAGHDKISFVDRERYTDEHLDDIIDSVDNPINGKRWWLKSDDPWQLLATAHELVEALRSPNPLEFESSIPVHQDGTCNGLQHYAALGGDVLGAAQVNLLPSEKPSDIYTAVAKRVDDRINESAKGDCKISQRMKGRVNRKLVKQTVMTSTYGVTFVGARQQVISRMREQPELYPFTDQEILETSLKITHLIFDELGELFKGARALQAWLNTTARMVAKSVPMDTIPAIQLEDAEFLSKLGALPSPFTVARAEVREGIENERAGADEPVDVKPKEENSLDDLLGAAMDDASVDELPTAEESEQKLAKSSEEAEEALAEASAQAAKLDMVKKPEKMCSVIWTTPLGLPIVQPYRVTKTKIVNTMIQTVTVSDPSTPMPVNPMKQSTAFPPNFIHSLDATHMMLSAIACQRAGLDFAAVHDSYWTHACDVDAMSSILRDAFVKLHSRDIMLKLREELMDRYKGHKYPVVIDLTDSKSLAKWKKRLEATGRADLARSISSHTKRRKIVTWINLEIPALPPRGDFNIHKVKESPYFFH
ncbi:DNA-directed RNA polymerase [Chytridiales sp. JEL 0842]|nr:DNA-directed RNA polymerase [Chytridiales sp. JEL 0842]